MRAGAVLVAGVLTMHWLCYLPGSGSASALGANAHGYLASTTPALLALIALVIVASLAISYGSARRDGGARRQFEAQAARFAAALLGVFIAQELGELAVAGSVAPGADAILGAGGWLLPPAAFLVGIVAALAARTLERVERRLAERAAVLPERREPPRQPFAAAPRGPRLATRGLAFGFARRPPPPLSAP